ncbi:hypothetical protein [Klebsiella pneumoniae IS33]|nr:hypothetical protein [Klebsiella pneumoniae IS33]
MLLQPAKINAAANMNQKRISDDPSVPSLYRNNLACLSI